MLDASTFVEVVFQNEVACEIVDHQIEVPFCMVHLYQLCLIIKENNEYILNIQLCVILFYEKIYFCTYIK